MPDDLGQIRAAVANGLTRPQIEALRGRPLSAGEVAEYKRATALARLRGRQARANREGGQPKSGAQRRREFSERAAEIGDLPPVADPERRERCEASILDFGIEYCGSFLLRPPCDAIRDYALELQGAIERGGLVHVRLPRGSGKTTWIKIAIVWGVATGRLRYPVIFAASASQGKSIVADLWSLFESPGEFADDFPEISVPIRALSGKFQRCASQTYHGERTQIRHSADCIVLPTIEGSASSGAIIASKGAGQSTRGLVRKSQRPDYVLLDDVSTRADATSQTRTDKLAAWIQSDVMGLQGAKMLAGCMTSTTIAHGDLSTIYADASRHPEFRLVEHRLVEAWPVREDLWREYDALWAKCQSEGDSSAATSTEFYQAHREEMDEGTVVLDPEAFDERFELSAIQHARNLLLRVGRDAFYAEYMLRPPTGLDVIACDAEMVAKAVNGCARRTLPPGTRECLAFVDIMADQLHWTVCAFGPHQTASVVDYGRYPERGRATPEQATDRAVESALARALASVVGALYATRFRDCRGREIPLYAVWMDCGWRQRVVLRVAEAFRRKGFTNTLGCKGFASSVYNQSAKKVLASGVGVDLREIADGGRFAAQNSDLFREQCQKGFLGEPLQPGSLSLWGDATVNHRAFAEQIAGERLADKAVSSRGVEIYSWTSQPGARNHWLDATSGCLAMASWYRFWDSMDAVAQAANAGTAAAPATLRPVSKPRRRTRMRIRTARCAG